MVKQSEIIEQRQIQLKNDGDKLNETFNTKGWKEIIYPCLENIYAENIEQALGEGHDSSESRAILKAIRMIFSKIGVHVNHAEKAKEFLSKKLKGE